MTREFDCTDCGIHVVSFGYADPNEPEICATCAWIRTTTDDPVERAKLREHVRNITERGEEKK